MWTYTPTLKNEYKPKCILQRKEIYTVYSLKIHSFSAKWTIQFNFNVFLPIFCNFWLIKNNIQLHLFAFKKKKYTYLQILYETFKYEKKKVNFPENNL